MQVEYQPTDEEVILSQAQTELQKQLQEKFQQNQQQSSTSPPSQTPSWTTAGRPVISIVADAPHPDIARDLTTEFQQLPGVKEVAYLRRDVAPPQVRISFTAESLPVISEMLQRVAKQTQQAHQSAYAGSSQQ